MTQEQKAAAWDALMRLMDDDGGDPVWIENARRLRRTFLTHGTWFTRESDWLGGPFDIALYCGLDPVAALDALAQEPPTP